MKIGIGLPATIPGMEGDFVLEWAKKADAGPFSSLGIIDRVAYGNYEPLISLAAVAGVTRRIRLMTTILVAPTRNTGILAKQAATLDKISGGRLTLGVAVGAREDDYQAAPASFGDRGDRFDEQLATLKRVWTGEPFDGAVKIGPSPHRKGGPELLIGGSSDAAMRRVGRWADGYIASPGDWGNWGEIFDRVEAAWKAEGRSGQPRLVAAAYYALGPNARERGGTYIRDYYAFLGDQVEYVVQGILTSPEAIQETVERASDMGVDEFMFWPTIADVDQVSRLAEATS